MNFKTELLCRGHHCLHSLINRNRKPLAGLSGRGEKCMCSRFNRRNGGSLAFPFKCKRQSTRRTCPKGMKSPVSVCRHPNLYRSVLGSDHVNAAPRRCAHLRVPLLAASRILLMASGLFGRSGCLRLKSSTNSSNSAWRRIITGVPVVVGRDFFAFMVSWPHGLLTSPRRHGTTKHRVGKRPIHTGTTT